MADFNPAVENLLRKEGGFAPRDNRAGSVNFGITAQFLRCIRHPKKPAELTREEAIELYRLHFWTPARCEAIRDQAAAELFFEAAVNMGLPQATRLLQRAASVEADGRIGPVTLHAVNSYQPAEFCQRFRQQALDFYEQLAASDSEYADDLKGWKARIGL